MTLVHFQCTPILIIGPITFTECGSYSFTIIIFINNKMSSYNRYEFPHSS